MSETVTRGFIRRVQWGEPPMAEQAGEATFALPVDTVTFLSADVAGSTRLRERRPEELSAGIARLDEVVNDAVGRHGGVRPIERGEGDSYVAAFARASDAAAAALSIQLADLAPVAVRMGLHTGEVQLRGPGNYIGSAVNRCARIRDLAHGGQTVLSQATRDLVSGALPARAWLIELGTHRLRDLARPEPVYQLAHPDLALEFPALRSLDAHPHNLPVELTSFVGRTVELAEARKLLDRARLVTLTGSGGCGKTRLALQTAAELLTDYQDGAWLAELAPVTDHDLVPMALAKALGVHVDPGRSPADAVVTHLADKCALIVLDNCEHLVSACAVFVETLLRSCPSVSVVATSREPLGVAGEVSWRIPSLTLPDEREPSPVGAVPPCEAVQLFAERAERALPGFAITPANESVVAEICRRLDGIPLAIELAAARVRVLTPDEILRRLEDRFRLFMGGTRTAMPRQQTLYASVDWSYQLLTDPEKLLFRRLAVFGGSFDMTAAETIGAQPPLETHQVLDQLSLLVDKSLVATIDANGESRYSLLETVRDYAAAKLDESGEADEIRRRHRDHYLTLAGQTFHEFCVFEPSWDRQTRELDNIRVAFRWSRQVRDTDAALLFAANLMPTWVGRGHEVEGRTWLDAVLDDPDTGTPLFRVLALAASGYVGGGALYWSAVPTRALEHAAEAVELARRLGDGGIGRLTLGYALGAAGWAEADTDAASAVRRFEEAVQIGRDLGDRVMLVNALGGLGCCLNLAGDPLAARAALDESHALDPDEVAVTFASGHVLCHVLIRLGDLAEGRALSERVVTAAEAEGHARIQGVTVAHEAIAAALMGDITSAHDLTNKALSIAQRHGAVLCEALANIGIGTTELAAGDAEAAVAAFERARELTADHDPVTSTTTLVGLAHAELAAGRLASASPHLDRAIAFATTSCNKYLLGAALSVAARRALATDEVDDGQNLCHRALSVRREIDDKVGMADCLELLAAFGVRQDRLEEATRVCAAAQALRDTIGSVRFGVDRSWYDASLGAMRSALGDTFDLTWSEGAELPLDEAMTYATRRRGERKRPLTGWASLTRAEVSVALLVGEGLANEEIATRLFVSPRTVQTHLTHIYAKLDVTSRVRLANEAARHQRGEP